jgi:hypothetical protein
VPLNDRRGLTEAETEILHRQWRRRHDQIHDAVAKHGADGGYQEAAPAQWTLLAWTSRSAAFDVTTRALTEYVGWLGGDDGY